MAKGKAKANGKGTPLLAGPAKRKRGRPEHEPNDATRGSVKAMSAFGVTVDEICLSLKISANTLRKYYGEELQTGRIEANVRVAEALFKIALSQRPQAAASAMFWLKTRAGWKETERHEIVGADGAPIETILSTMTTEEAAEIYGKLLRGK